MNNEVVSMTQIASSPTFSWSLAIYFMRRIFYDHTGTEAGHYQEICSARG